MTNIHRAYDALIEKIEEKLSQSYRDNDQLSHENTLREMVMTDFVYEYMGSAGVMALAAVVDQHERKTRNDPDYNYGFLEMVKVDYPEKEGTWVQRSKK